MKVVILVLDDENDDNGDSSNDTLNGLFKKTHPKIIISHLEEL